LVSDDNDVCTAKFLSRIVPARDGAAAIALPAAIGDMQR
jgi:hypothetical protein